MKVIDLIYKQYCDEEMPKHIKINRLNYTYDNNIKTYKSEYGEFMSFDFTTNVLNMQVELIKDEIDIDNIEELDMITEKDDNLLRNIVDNQNLILKWAKQADKEIKSIKEK